MSINASKKFVGILGRKFASGKILKICVCKIREKSASKSGLAALARSEQGDGGIFPHLGLDVGCDFPVYHNHNIYTEI